MPPSLCLKCIELVSMKSLSLWQGMANELLQLCQIQTEEGIEGKQGQAGVQATLGCAPPWTEQWMALPR